MDSIIHENCRTIIENFTEHKCPGLLYVLDKNFNS